VSRVILFRELQFLERGDRSPLLLKFRPNHSVDHFKSTYVGFLHTQTLLSPHFQPSNSTHSLTVIPPSRKGHPFISRSSSFSNPLNSCPLPLITPYVVALTYVPMQADKQASKQSTGSPQSHLPTDLLSYPILSYPHDQQLPRGREIASPPCPSRLTPPVLRYAWDE
jgi:hypothetical protein